MLRSHAAGAVNAALDAAVDVERGLLERQFRVNLFDGALDGWAEELGAALDGGDEEVDVALPVGVNISRCSFDSG